MHERVIFRGRLWRLEQTGGNCTGYVHDLENGGTLLLTAHEEPSVPEPGEECVIGAYDADGNAVRMPSALIAPLQLRGRLSSLEDATHYAGTFDGEAAAAVLARAFAGVLRSWLTPEQLADVDARNVALRTRGACASHDYCDANEAMAEAFRAVVGRGVDLYSGAGVALWNEAWGIAAAAGFADGAQ